MTRSAPPTSPRSSMVLSSRPAPSAAAGWCTIRRSSELPDLLHPGEGARADRGPGPARCDPARRGEADRLRPARSVHGLRAPGRDLLPCRQWDRALFGLLRETGEGTGGYPVGPAVGGRLSLVEKCRSAGLAMQKREGFWFEVVEVIQISDLQVRLRRTLRTSGSPYRGTRI